MPEEPSSYARVNEHSFVILMKIQLFFFLFLPVENVMQDTPSLPPLYFHHGQKKCVFRGGLPIEILFSQCFNDPLWKITK